MDSKLIKFFIYNTLFNNNNFPDLYFLRNEKIKYIPNTLYKYYSVIEDNKRDAGTKDYGIENLENDIVFFQNPSKFNDPFDCYLGASYERLYQECFNKLDQLNDNNPDLLNAKKSIIEASKNLCKTIAENEIQAFRSWVENYIKVSCFSSNLLSPLMWSHYSNKHFGFCLEYDFSCIGQNITYDVESNLFRAQLMLFPVIYFDQRPLIDDMQNSKDKDRLLTNTNYIYNLLIKSNDWDYEKEWRIFLFDKRLNIIKLMPKHIFLGFNIQDSAKNRILSIAKDKGIPVYIMKLYPDKFSFYPDQIQ